MTKGEREQRVRVDRQMGWGDEVLSYWYYQRKQDFNSVRKSNKNNARSIGATTLPWGHCLGINPICMDTKDGTTLCDGIRARLCRDIPVPNRFLLKEFEHFVAKWVEEHTTPITAMTFEEWLETTNYNIHRKQQLTEAHEQFNGAPPTSACRKVKTHGKRESYPEYKNARSINSRTDVFKAYSGPFFKSIEEQLYKDIHFVKHLTPEERAQRVSDMRNIQSNTYATDFTAFESHFSTLIMEKCEMLLYKHMMKNYPKDFKKIQKVLTGVNNMRSRTGVKADLLARRMSGEMNTSLGNGFSNFMICNFLAQHHGAKIMDGIFEGDDGLFYTDTTLTTQMFQELGFTVKLEQRPAPSEASFCGLIFNESHETIREPVRFLQSFGWTESYMTASTSKQWQLLHAKSLSALHETPQCPIIGVMAREALSRSSHVPALFTDDYKAKLYNKPWVATPFAPSSLTRELFAKMYKIDTPTQLLIEQHIMNDQLDMVAQHLHIHPHIADYASRFVEWHLV